MTVLVAARARAHGATLPRARGEGFGLHPATAWRRARGGRTMRRHAVVGFFSESSPRRDRARHTVMIGHLNAGILLYPPPMSRCQSRFAPPVCGTGTAEGAAARESPAGAQRTVAEQLALARRGRVGRANGGSHASRASRVRPERRLPASAAPRTSSSSPTRSYQVWSSRYGAATRRRTFQ